MKKIIAAFLMSFCTMSMGLNNNPLSYLIHLDNKDDIHEYIEKHPRHLKVKHIQWLIEQDNWKMVYKLVEKIMKTNPDDVGIHTVLTTLAITQSIGVGYCSVENRLQAMQILLKRGWDINEKDCLNLTALIIAVNYDCLKLVRFLVENGAKKEPTHG